VIRQKPRQHPRATGIVRGIEQDLGIALDALQPPRPLGRCESRRHRRGVDTECIQRPYSRKRVSYLMLAGERESRSNRRPPVSRPRVESKTPTGIG